MYKGIILAGGSGTRLYPSSMVVSKQLINVYDKPLIYYPLSTLMIAGIRDILIITNNDQIDQFKKLLGDGSQWSISLSYKIQDEPNGLPEAFILAEDFIGDDNVCLILGDNVIYGNELDSILLESQKNEGATILSYSVNDPERFGIIEYSGSKVLSIEEKPDNPKSNKAIIGIYFCDNKAVQYAKEVKPSKRNELEIVDVWKKYLQNEKLSVKHLNRGITWIDAGTFDSLLTASNIISNIEKVQYNKISCPEEISWRKGWITDNDLRKLSKPLYKSGYGKYLEVLLEENK